ncbi:MAG: glycosyltransferase [Ilumatobacter sp.]|nr:glycosyltransferase [Ilumatobacter sp.]
MDASESHGLTILFALDGLNVGGIETNVVRLTQELTARGHSVLAASSGGVLEDQLADAGGTHVRCAFMSLRGLGRSSRTLARVIRERRPDVIHTMSARAAVAVWLATMPGRLRRGPRRPAVVSSVMGLRLVPEERLLWTALRVYLTAVGSQRSIVISPTIGRFFRWMPVRRRRLVEMPVVGVDVPTSIDRVRARADLGAELAIADDDAIVSTIGVLAPRKQHEMFIRAAAVFDQRVKARFLIVGGGPLREELEAEIRKCRLEEVVLLLGERSDLDRILGATDVYVRPGMGEGGAGTTLYHAQAVAVPVIGFDSADTRAAVEPGVTAVLVPPGDVTAVADAIGQLLTERDLATAIGERGRTTVERHSITAVTDGLVGLYRSVATGE